MNRRFDRDGFRRVGSGYERKGWGGRLWRINREHGCFALRLETFGDAAAELLAEEPDLVDAFEPYAVEDVGATLAHAIVLARTWDEQFRLRPGATIGKAENLKKERRAESRPARLSAETIIPQHSR